jgi:hypothetical protein
MKYTYDYIISRVGEKGYLDLVAVFQSIGFVNVHDVPDTLWAAAVTLYEERLFRDAA